MQEAIKIAATIGGLAAFMVLLTGITYVGLTVAARHCERKSARDHASDYAGLRHGEDA